jgi:polyhydroxybutyrate depolymerase
MKVSLKGAFIAGSMTLLMAASFIDFYLMKPGRLRAPALDGTLVYQSLQHDGRLRRYAVYLPANLATGAPLVMALHGAKSDGTGMRLLTGHRLDHLADRYGMAVVYPEGEHRQWNDCRRDDSEGNPQHDAPDDVGFLHALRDELAIRHGIDSTRMHVVGFSDGGQMGLRLALQTPKALASLSIIGTNMPSPDRSLCGPLPHDAPPVLMINGTHDRLNPYYGGDAEMTSGAVITMMSATGTAAWLAGAGALRQATQPFTPPAEDGCRVERMHWRNGERQVALYTVHGGGHTLPQPYVRYPRLLGHTHGGFDGLAAIGSFLLSHNAPTQALLKKGCLQC